MNGARATSEAGSWFLELITAGRLIVWMTLASPNDRLQGANMIVNVLMLSEWSHPNAAGFLSATEERKATILLHDPKGHTGTHNYRPFAIL